MKNITRFALACTAALTVSASAFAGVIVDTGPGEVPYSVNGSGLTSTQWLAGAFTLTERETITGINGWLNGNAGTLRLAVHSAKNGVPGDTLFTTDIKAGTFFTGSWAGASGLDWTLDAGTYFAAFEIPTGYTFAGGMSYGAASPTRQSAFTDENGNWHVTPAPIGYQVFGDPVAAQNSSDVPEPSTMALSGLALAALATARKRAGKTRA